MDGNRGKRMKIPFTSIFTINKRGKWETLVKIRVSGITIEAGVEYLPIPLKDFVGNDLDVRTDGDTMIIKGIF